MGFLNSDYIRQFVSGQTIAILEDDEAAPGCFRLRFENGESLRIAPRKRGCKCCEVEIIATPYRTDGEVKQSTEIKESQNG